MLKSVFATLLAGTIGFTTLVAPTPVRADAEFNRALAGLIALGVIANQLEKNNRKHTTRNQTYHEPVHQPRRSHNNHGHKKHHTNKRHSYHPRGIPARCIFKFHTHQGWKKVVGPRCVSKRAPWVSLPRHCGKNIWTNKGKKYVMGRHCLKKKGYFYI